DQCHAEPLRKLAHVERRVERDTRVGAARTLGLDAPTGAQLEFNGRDVEAIENHPSDAQVGASGVAGAGQPGAAGRRTRGELGPIRPLVPILGLRPSMCRSLMSPLSPPTLTLRGLR